MPTCTKCTHNIHFGICKSEEGCTCYMDWTSCAYEDERHRMSIHWEEDDQRWVVTFPELKRCIAHGTTPEEAIALGRVHKEAWLNLGHENRDSVPKPVHMKIGGER